MQHKKKPHPQLLSLPLTPADSAEVSRPKFEAPDIFAHARASAEPAGSRQFYLPPRSSLAQLPHQRPKRKLLKGAQLSK